MKFNKEIWCRARRKIESGNMVFACNAIRQIAITAWLIEDNGIEGHAEAYVAEFSRVAFEMFSDNPPFWNRTGDGGGGFRDMRLAVFDKLISLGV